MRALQIALVSAGLAALSCHLLYPFDSKPLNPDADTGSGADVTMPFDGPRPEGALVDGLAGLDAPVALPVTCGAPIVVNAMTDVTGTRLDLVGPALRPDHQHLVAQLKGSTQSFIATRAADGVHFDTWKPYDPLHGYRDPSFYLRGSEQVLLVNAATGGDTLQHCQVQSAQLSGCQELTIQLPSLKVLGNADVKAILVPILETANELIFSGQAGTGGMDLYWGKQTVGGTAVTVDPIPSLSSPAEDTDPAISPDGGLVVFSSNRFLSQGKHDLWVALRNPFDTSGFFPPIPMFFVHPELGSAADEGGPDLAVVDGLLELYFHSDRSGRWEIYRAACNLP